MELLRISKCCWLIAIVAISRENFACNSHGHEHYHEGQCGANVYCRCPEHGPLLEDVSGGRDALRAERTTHRCAKCEERKKEERAKLAQTIVANIAQFFQGMVMLASSGKEADDKLKAEQCALMAQAVGNLIYTAHEHHRYDVIGLDIREGVDFSEKNNAFNKKLYHYIRYVVADFIADNPDYCKALIANTMKAPSAT